MSNSTRTFAARQGEGGFTLVEAMVCTLVLMTGLLSIAGLLAVTTQMHVGAREAARSTRIAQDKIDELMKLNFSTDPEVAIGGSLAENETNYWETPEEIDGGDVQGVTVRWVVEDGPIDDTRLLTVRVVNLRAQTYGRQVDLSTVIRQW